MIQIKNIFNWLIDIPANTSWHKSKAFVPVDGQFKTIDDHRGYLNNVSNCEGLVHHSHYELVLYI